MLGQRLKTILRTGFTGLSMVIAGGLMLASPSLAVAADVADGAGLFSLVTVEKANEVIREVEKKTGHDIRIETYATVPGDKVEAVAKMDKKEKDEFTHEWVSERALKTKSEGVVVLICKDPHRVETWISPKLKELGFTKDDRDHVKNATIAGLTAGKFDGALHDTVVKLREIYTRIDEQHGKKRSLEAVPIEQAPATPHRIVNQQNEFPIHRPVPVPQRAGWGPVFFILMIIVGGIFVISILSRLFGGGRRGYGGGGYGGSGPGPGYGGPGYGAPGYGGGGGGFMNGIAGGLLGAVAGNWLSGAFGGGQSAHAHDYTPPPTGPLGGGQNLGDNSPPAGTQWSDNDGSGGGNWGGGGGGNSGGGGDWGGGGGDSGGGGGDWGGGGGGDSGGGGGDWGGGGGGDSGGGGGGDW